MVRAINKFILQPKMLLHENNENRVPISIVLEKNQWKNESYASTQNFNCENCCLSFSIS